MRIISVLVFVLLSEVAFAQFTWIKRNDFVGGMRSRATSTAVNGKGYIGLGASIVNVQQSDWWEYNPVSGTWTQKATFPGDDREAASAFSIGNIAYVGLGLNVTSTYNFLNDFWAYDPTTDTWTQKASLPVAGRSNASTFVIGDKGYFCLGQKSSTTLTNELWEYSSVTDTWTKKSNFPGGEKHWAIGFSINGKGYVFGGSGNGIFFNDLWEYNPTTDAWTQKASLPGVGRACATSMVMDDKAMIIGGYQGSTYFSDVWQYDPSANSWTQLSDFPGPYRAASTSFTIDNKGYITLGDTSINNPYLNDLWEFADVTANISDVYQKNIVMKIFPNPSAGQVNLLIDGLEDGDLNVEFYDVTGRIVLLDKQLVSPSKTMRTYDVESLDSGLYMIKVYNTHFTRSTRLVIQK